MCKTFQNLIKIQFQKLYEISNIYAKKLDIKTQ